MKSIIIMNNLNISLLSIFYINKRWNLKKIIYLNLKKKKINN